MQNQFRFSLLGANIELRSNSDVDYMKQILRYLEQKLEVTRDKLELHDALKLSIVTSFLLIDDLLCERNERKGQLSLEEGLKAEEITQQMIDDLHTLEV